MTALKKIGFVGTGIMGSAMAGHLMDAGFDVSVYNRTKSKAQALIERGARWCDTVAECAAGQDVVITIVGYPKDVEQIYLGAGGIIESARAGAYLVDMTTSSPILAEKIFHEISFTFFLFENFVKVRDSLFGIGALMSNVRIETISFVESCTRTFNDNV